MRYFLCIVLLLFIFCSWISGAIPDRGLKITHLTGNFYVYVSFGRFGKQDYPANAMYLVTRNGVVLFDTPWDESYYQPLLDSIRNRHHKKVLMCISTHFHEDRTGGLKYYNSKGIITYTTAQTDSLCRVHNENRAVRLIHKDTTFNVGGYVFETYYPGPGHTADNITIWFPRQKILYGGCLIKSVDDSSLGNLDDANVKEWGHSLQKLQSKCKNPEYIITGHSDWTDLNSVKHTLEMVNAYNRKKQKP